MRCVVLEADWSVVCRKCPHSLLSAGNEMQSWPHGNLERFKAKAFLFNYMPFYVPERPAVARVNEYIRKRHNKEATDTTAAEALSEDLSIFRNGCGETVSSSNWWSGSIDIIRRYETLPLLGRHPGLGRS